MCLKILIQNLIVLYGLKIVLSEYCDQLFNNIRKMIDKKNIFKMSLILNDCILTWFLIDFI